MKIRRALPVRERESDNEIGRGRKGAYPSSVTVKFTKKSPLVTAIK